MEEDPVAQFFLEERENEEEEEELELGLCLGAKNLTGGKNNSNTYGGRCRILTAKDFAAVGWSRASPSSSISSSEGAKRVADVESDNTPSPIVGWPPIRIFRINNLVHQSKEDTSNFEAITDKKNNQNLRNDNECINTKNQQKRIENVGITRFIKVKMDGDPIGRKVDLNAHQSYETLALALELMFHISSSPYSTKDSKLLDGFSEFALTYEDKEGDWMLAGDVPWEMFLDSVKRLRIMRTSDSNGLASRFQSSTGGQLRNKPV